jgi:hypothetical protein
MMLAGRVRPGYTVVEMLTTIAALIIVLGLMVSLTGHVRASSSEVITKDLLRRLDQAMSRYTGQNGGFPPNIPPFIEGQAPIVDEAPLARRAEINNQSVIRLLKSYHALPPELFDDLSMWNYDGQSVHDAWGSPIVFMAAMNPAVGMAAKGWFFFSAGPDRKYTTKSDNLYSYELPGLDQASH